MKHVVVFGEAAHLITAALSEAGMPAERVTHGGSLAGAVQAAASLAQPGDTVLLSPGGTQLRRVSRFRSAR